MTEMKREEVEVLDHTEGDGDEEILIPVKVMIDRLQAALEKVPEQFRESALFRIWAAGGDCSYAYVNLRYERPETDGERRARAQYTERRDNEYLARERAEYDRLKAKFDAPPSLK